MYLKTMDKYLPSNTMSLILDEKKMWNSYSGRPEYYLDTSVLEPKTSQLTPSM